MSSTPETRTYTGLTGGPGGFDGYAGLVIGKTYGGVLQSNGTVAITLLNGRTTSVTIQQWQDWFEAEPTEPSPVDDDRFDF